MRIGVVSDTHLADGRRLPADLLQALEGVDGIFHLGDITDLSVLDALREIAPVEAVYGNMDPLSTRRALPERRIVELAGFRLGLVHGSGAPEGLAERLIGRFRGEDLDVLLFGHSHRPEVRTVGGVLVLNPGSPVTNPFSVERTCAILHLEGEARGEIVRLGSEGSGGD